MLGGRLRHRMGNAGNLWPPDTGVWLRSAAKLQEKMPKGLWLEDHLAKPHLKDVTNPTAAALFYQHRASSMH